MFTLKKYLVLATLALCLWSLPTQAATTFTNGNYKYTVTSANTVRMDGLAEGKSVTKVTIPETVKSGNKTYAVTSIKAEAFKGNKTITSTNTGPNVKSIGADAFTGCTKLAKVSVGIALESVEGTPFSGAPITTVQFTEGRTRIPANLFANSKLEAITIRNTVNYIEEGAFKNCTKLTNITIPTNVTQIGANVFSGCTSLITVTLTEGLREVGTGAFSGCTKLKSLTLPNSLEECHEEAFKDSITSVSFATGRTAIQTAMFQGANKLTAIIIPETVTTIEEDAFNGSGLKQITFNNGLKSIGDKAFYNCDNLTAASLPTGLESVGSDAFGACNALVSVTLPKSLASVGENGPFAYSALNTVIFETGVTTIPANLFRRCQELKSVSIPATVTSIGDSAFRGSTITSIIIPDSVTSMGSYTFAACSKLKKCIFGNGLTQVPESVLNNCVLLTSVTLPKKVESIGRYAFVNCESLSAISLPDSLTSIGAGAFYGCTQLREISVPPMVSILGDSSDQDYGVFQNCSNLKDVVLPVAITKLNAYTFAGCTSLEDVIIPYRVRILGKGVFNGCNALSVVVPRSVTSMPSYIFPTGTVMQCGLGSYAQSYAKSLGYAYEENTRLATGLELYPKATYVELGKAESYNLLALVTPIDAVDTISLVTSDSKVVVVDTYGNVTAVGGGKASVTATVGKHSAKVDFFVESPLQDMSMVKTNIVFKVLGASTEVQLNKVPADATDTIIWESSDLSVATVRNGKVTAKGVGEAVITASTASGIATSCNVTVHSVSLAAPVARLEQYQNGDFKLAWDKVANATSYEVYVGSNDSFTKLNKSFDNKTLYYKCLEGKQYKVRAVLTSFEKTVYSPFSNVIVSTVYKPEQSQSSTNTKAPASDNSKEELEEQGTSTSVRPVLKQKSVTPKSVTLSWSNVPGATGYELVRSLSDGTECILVTKVSGTSYKNTKLYTATGYKYWIRAYSEAGGVKSFGTYSAPLSVNTKPTTPTLTLKRNGIRTIKASWKSEGGQKYEVYYGRKKASLKRVKTTKAFSYTKKKLAKGKHYFKVRAYYTVGGKKIYSSWSKVKNLRIK